ncbi:hypothetical protein CONPUDRAFT_156578 [Coniophora puteana RWD-64-598 SS2]|uniref:Uncharacterized protein n=1 Tax=Coniophora puteana (strain RWD-64-598) TaxID=741705 RepID=A0A5M3MIY7_CONPW|nr:uncharacterized protein CONPUDRAFT_156578 [Coniophora puteana RWD-64-598 SS2]EIW78605.1 hypothetical protein CONPUDRAFT_156578 [Coniophora puteana RWD-64-598 SS2]
MSHDITLSEISQLVTDNPALSPISLTQILDFVDRCCVLRSDFAFVQQGKRSSANAPPVIPIAHARWLSSRTRILFPLLNALWTGLKNTIWAIPSPQQRLNNMVGNIEETGWKKGIVAELF